MSVDEPTNENRTPNEAPDMSFDDFTPGDVVRFQNGNGVTIDGVVQIGRPPAYGYTFDNRHKLVVRTFGQTDETHVAPDERQNDQKTDPTHKWAMEQGLVDDEDLFVVSPADVLAVNPEDTDYERDERKTVFPEDELSAPEYLDERYYD